MTAAAETHGRKLEGQGLGYDSVGVGDWFETDRRAVTIAMIDSFAELTGDRFEIHMDDAAARRHGFPARVAHGLLVLSLVDGLKNQAQSTFRAVASLGWTWSFDGAVLAGDTIGVHVVIADGRSTRRADRAILTLRFRVTNQRGEMVQSGTNQLMVYR